MTILQERSREWQLNLWTATVDFKKAFDTVDHNRLWRALANQEIPTPYIDLLKTMYTDQTATVKTDKAKKST